LFPQSLGFVKNFRAGAGEHKVQLELIFHQRMVEQEGTTGWCLQKSPDNRNLRSRNGVSPTISHP
jgi:hypothetical protein